MSDFLQGFREREYQQNRESLYETQCPFCSMQCKMNLHEDRSTQKSRLKVTPLKSDPVSEGRLCPKGIFSYKHAIGSGRLRTPLLKVEHSFVPVSWEQAYHWLYQKIASVQKKYGKNALSVYGSGALTNEKAYLLGKFSRVALETKYIDYNGRFCMSSAASASNQAFGVDRGLTNPLSEIEDAECIILAGTNVAECQPTMMPYFRRAKANGSKIIVIDPRETLTSKFADLHLKIKPGLDSALVNGMLKVMVDEDYVNHSFVQESVEGGAELLAFARSIDMNEVERVTGVAKNQIIEAARLYGRASTGMVFTARGVEQHAGGVNTVRNFINLVLMTGKIGKQGCGYGTITGQGNGQGGREHGQKADQLAGYRLIENVEHRNHMAKVWGIQEDKIPGKGVSAYELFEKMLEQEIHGMIVLGSNPVVSNPNTNLVKSALGKLDFLVVIDTLMSETVELADLILPGSTYLEEEGTMTNLEGRVILRKAAKKLPGEARLDWKILCEISELLGKGKYFPYQTSEDIFEELRKATKGGIADYAGITYNRIEEEKGVFWPCPSESHPGTPRMFVGGQFHHENGKARVTPIANQFPKERTDEEFPLTLTTGRILHHYQTGVQTRITSELNKTSEPFLEIHPTTAKKLGLVDKEKARICSRRGEMILKAKFSPGIREDCVFVPFHWGGKQSINQLTLPELDPQSKMPEFKACAVRVTALEAERDVSMDGVLEKNIERSLLT
ncbi:molybdopterin oxidoreductase family protein [Mesobacillus maritimus]|uniref:assimilatory nitrate reductase catalytic subunit NasC n=1 Tax=Mesobacillus maritimus TaxID=1643336 RepID=UPI00203E4FCB|nr:molybdopterin oxidoreductase family protein [Mesobacillus maritimus]MCM3587751.1 molybdopterin oxidoreductase family protein [Mesobacillus maritimus]